MVTYEFFEVNKIFNIDIIKEKIIDILRQSKKEWRDYEYTADKIIDDVIKD